MEANKKLKLIPLHQFFKAMDGPSRALYLILFAAFLTGLGLLGFAIEDPARWSMTMEAVHDTRQESVLLRTYEHGYRTMQTDIGAWKESVTYFGSPISSRPWMLWAFAVLQVLGWAYLLTAASYIKNFVAYAIFFLYAMAIFLSRAFEAVAPDQYWLFNIGLAVLVLAPAYLFHQGNLQWRFAFRLPLFTAITAIPFAISAGVLGWPGLHAASVGMFPLLAFVAIIYLIFISKDLSQLMFFVGTNLPRQSWRWSFPVFLAVWLILCALQFLMLHNVMGWKWIPGAPEFPMRPAHFMLAVSVVLPGLNQNLWYVLKGSMDNRAFSVLLTAFGLVVVSGMFLPAATGEFLYVYAFERLLALLFFLGTLLHFFYMYYNFSDFLRGRTNFYFLSMMPKRLMFAFVVAATVLASLALEASEGMKTQRLLKSVTYSLTADDEALHGRTEQALAMYAASVDVAIGNSKANYNLAMLLMQVGGDLDLARERLQDASSFFHFAPAWINLGNLEMAASLPRQAKYHLRQGWNQVKDPLLANNLAQVHLALAEPDSAILAMKDALRLDPERSDLYANLGRIYLEHEKYEAAEDFLAEGLSLTDVGPALVTNALFLNMKGGTDLKLPDDIRQRPGISASATARFNMAVERYQKHDLDGATALLDTLVKADATPDVLLLDGMLRFEKGDIAGSVSRMAFLDVNYPEFQPYTNHFLGAAFFGEGLPEVAATFFGKSVENGRADDLFPQACMEIDRGDHEFGFMLLNQARTQDSSLFDEVAREEALLQVANGEYFFAGLGFDLGTLTPQEWVRAGRYAGHKGNRPAALEAFRHAIERDSTLIEPYLEMGRISIRLGDSLAAENLRPGLKRQPKHIGLRIELARAAIMTGDMGEAKQIHQALLQEAPKDPAVAIFDAEMSLALGDTNAALEKYKVLHKAQPLRAEPVLALARIMRAKDMDYEGQNLLSDALAINPRNPDYWHEMALYERIFDRVQEVAFAAQKAISLETRPGRAQLLAETFKEELAAFPATTIEE